MKALLFAGAGTSIELGVPGMAGLATEFLEHCRQWGVEPSLVERILGSNLDVEHLIEELDRICAAAASLRSIGQDTAGLKSAEKVRAEVEWFVQHVAERVAAREAQLMWGSVLRATKNIDITLVTMNYDRAIELAANGEGISLDDGFRLFAEGETVEWTGFGRGERRTMLVKLHGSTDWFADRPVGIPIKLRHPMPLFGRSVLMFDERELDSALVLPSREKMLTGAPYPRLSQTFLNAADYCDVGIFVGSSLRDDHIRDAARSIVERATVFIVNPEGSNQEVEGAITIAQHASTFLVSTLPNALLTSDPAAFLRNGSGESRQGERGILTGVRDLLDNNVETSRRCRSLEELDEMEATLDPLLIRKLLCDADPTVARYALGLIPSSTARKELIEIAGGCPHSGNLAFQEDLEILRNLDSANHAHNAGPVGHAKQFASLPRDSVEG